MSEDIRALIFDCDGTLVDNMPIHFAAWCQTLERHDLALPEDRFYQLGGVPTEKIVRMLAVEAGREVNVAEVSLEKERSFEQQAATLDPRPIEVVVSIAREHRGRVPMAVATGSLLSNAERSLRRAGILEWFDTVVAAEDVDAHKPAPDVFLEAARRLDVLPGSCRAYEDTDLGLQAIHAAGMHAVDIRTLL